MGKCAGGVGKVQGREGESCEKVCGGSKKRCGGMCWGVGEVKRGYGKCGVRGGKVC